MTRYVWLSHIMSDSRIGQKQGLHVKRFGADWDPATEVPPRLSGERYQIARKYLAGLPLEREEMVECAAIFDEDNFCKTKDIFISGGPFAVKGKLAEVLLHFDLSPGGLCPLPIYRTDHITPVDGPFYLLNFGAQKQTFLPEKSAKDSFEAFAVKPDTGEQVWKIHSWVKDDDIALSADACEGADIWFDPSVYNKIFMSDALVTQLRSAKVKVDFQLIRCRVLDGED